MNRWKSSSCIITFFLSEGYYSFKPDLTFFLVFSWKSANFSHLFHVENIVADIWRQIFNTSLACPSRTHIVFQYFQSFAYQIKGNLLNSNAKTHKFMRIFVLVCYTHTHTEISLKNDGKTFSARIEDNCECNECEKYSRQT